eukprot:TRINITY_DN122536_c0_g1_i1.p1 TRINITY_DN122536_c0_g1~~TRINITY_DN122536_c0_g1_i1.p1  ORF type:complete len:636 (-),score=33.31 TRINITY_DN122536_c0_g1_i1:512-2194(-)
MTLEVSPQTKNGYAEPQRVVLDTGSSTLAFCDKSLADEFIQVDKVGEGGNISCISYTTGSGFWGYKATGKVALPGLPGVALEGAMAAMEASRDMPCVSGVGLQGIMGFGLYRANPFIEVAKVPDSWPAPCPRPLPQGTSHEPNLVLEALRESTKNGGNSTFGITLSPPTNGKFTEGTLYFGATAIERTHENSSQEQELYLYLNHFQNLPSYYLVPLSMSVGTKTLTYKRGSKFALLDTGSPVLLIPLELYQEACLETYEYRTDINVPYWNCKTTRNETLKVVLYGSDGGSTEIEIDLNRFNGPEFTTPTSEWNRKFLVNREVSWQAGLGTFPYPTSHPFQGVQFGFPFWQFYSTLFKIPSNKHFTGGSFSIAPLPQAAPPVSPSPSCFAGETIIQSLHGPTMVRDVQPGDVISNGMRYEVVLGFLHSLNAESTVVTIEHAEGELRVSGKHILLLDDGEAVAEGILVGDKLKTLNGLSQVTGVRLDFTDLGMFAPLTPSGRLLVDGVQASNYATTFDSRVPESALHSSFFLLRASHWLGLSDMMNGKLGQAAAWYVPAPKL